MRRQHRTGTSRRRPSHRPRRAPYSIYFILIDWRMSPATAKLADLKLGGPTVIVGLREKPKPSFGRKIAVSSLLLRFSSWTTAIASVHVAGVWTEKSPASAVFPALRPDALSLLQSGARKSVV